MNSLGGLSTKFGEESSSATEGRHKQTSIISVANEQGSMSKVAKCILYISQTTSSGKDCPNLIYFD